MHTPLRTQIKVIGIGNAWRADDAAGLLVAQRIQQENLPLVEVYEILGTTGDIQEAWKGTASAIVVDAVCSGGLPGAIYRFDAHAPGTAFPLSRSSSSHGWGLAEALALGQVFQDLPPYLIIYGIEGKNFQPGQDLSPEVAAAIPETVYRIMQEIQAWMRPE